MVEADPFRDQMTRVRTLMQEGRIKEAASLMEGIASSLKAQLGETDSAVLFSSKARAVRMAHAMVAWADRLLVDGAYRQTTSSLHDTAVEIARRMGDNEVVSGILQAVAISFWQHGDTPTAASWYERALGEARGASEDWLLYVLETMTAFLLETPSDHARGLACAEEFAACVSAFKQTAGTPKEAVAQLVLGHARLRAGDKQGALDAYEKARAVCHANGLANKLLAEVNQSIDGLPRV